MRRLLPLHLLALSALCLPIHGCAAPPAQYDVRGQVLQVDGDRGVVTIRHEDIKGFMPAMTMPFKVKDKGLLKAPRRGDLVHARLVVTDTDAYLARIEIVGHREVAQTMAAELPLPTPVLQPGDAVPDVTLRGTDGRSFNVSSLRGSAVALTFIYTRCPLPQFCPLMDRQFATVAGRLTGDERLRRSVRMLSISFDPEYDSPTVLAAHAARVGADGTLWRFATADRPAIDGFAPRFGMVVVREADNSITHNLRTAIIDPQGRLVKIYNGGDWTPDEMLADLARTAGT